MRVRLRRERSRHGEAWQPLLYLKLVALGLIAAYAIAFVIENHKQITIHFVFAKAKVSLIWEILLCLGIGVLGGVLLSQLYRRRRRQEVPEPVGEAPDALPDLPGGHEAESKTG